MLCYVLQFFFNLLPSSVFNVAKNSNGQTFMPHDFVVCCLNRNSFYSFPAIARLDLTLIFIVYVLINTSVSFMESHTVFSNSSSNVKILTSDVKCSWWYLKLLFLFCTRVFLPSELWYIRNSGRRPENVATTTLRFKFKYLSVSRQVHSLFQTEFFWRETVQEKL
jgi:hypothetical protein